MSKKRSKRKGSMNNTVSIVIPFYVAYDELERCLSCIPDGMGNIKYDVTLVDDGNELNNKHREFFHSLDGSIKVVRSSTNLGYPGAVNLGVKRSFSRLIFVLSSDVYLEPNSGVALVNAMEDEKVGICGMKLIFPLDSTHPHTPPGKLQHIGLHTNAMGEMVHTFIGWSPDNPRVMKVQDVYAVTGAAFITRRKIWTEVGGFSLDYGKGYYEDMDYCLFVRKLGYNIIVDQDAVAYHAVGASFAGHNLPHTFQENRVTFMQKWGRELEYTEYQVL